MQRLQGASFWGSIFGVCLMLVLGLVACGGEGNAIENPPLKSEVTARFKAAPNDAGGDMAKGSQLLARLPCLTCHAIGGNGGAVGPPLDKIGTNAANRVPEVSGAQYIYHILTNPQDANLPNYRNTVMPSFATTISQQELRDLVAYLLTLK